MEIFKRILLSTFFGTIPGNQTAYLRTDLQTPSVIYTTRPVPTFAPTHKETDWMSPARQEHQSKHIESVIYEPLPRIVLSRSTYKITSFIQFAPYIEAFKKFERFLNRFTRDLNDPEVVGPLFNINRTKTDTWSGPKSEYFRGICKKNAYRCRLVKQFKLIRSQTKKIKVLFQEIYLQFIRAIDSTGYHPTSGRKKGSKGTRLKRSARIKIPPSERQFLHLDEEDEIMIRNGNIITKYLLAQTQQDKNNPVNNEPEIQKDGRILIKNSQQYKNTQERVKRFVVASAILGWNIHKNKESIEELKSHIDTLYQQNQLQEAQIFELAHFLNSTYGYMTENRMAIYELNSHLMRINKTLIGVISEVKFIKFTIAIITDARSAVSRMMLGLITLRQNVNAVYEFMRVLATYKVNSVMIPPYSLRLLLEKVKEDMKRNPRLRLPENPIENVWSYYSLMRVTPVVMENFLAIVLTIPLVDISLQMNVYKVHNLRTLHPELKVQFTYELEGDYLAISKDGIYAALPSASDIRICEATDGYLCMLNQALYPVERIEWCIYALYERDYDKIGEYCVIKTKQRHANLAQSLDGYMWAISPMKEEKIQLRCLTQTTIEVVKPPLTVLYVGNGCEAYSSTMYIPAKSELTSHDPELTRHVFFLDFNAEYQNLTRYSMIEDLHFEQLTTQEKQELPNRLTALPPLKFNHLKKRIKPHPDPKPPFKIHPNIVLIILLVAILLVVVTLGFIFWRVYKVRSRVKGFKPMVKLFTTNQDDFEKNIKEIIDLVKNPVGHLTKTFITSSLEDIAHTTRFSPRAKLKKPQPPPRESSLPLEDLELIKQVTISEETLKDVVEDLKATEPQKYKGYIKKLKEKNPQP